MCIGVLLSVPYFSSLAELFSGPVIGVMHGLSSIFWFGYDFIFPLLDVKANGNSRIHFWSFSFSGVIMIGALLNHCFTLECSGLSRAEMRKKLKNVTRTKII